MSSSARASPKKNAAKRGLPPRSDRADAPPPVVAAATHAAPYALTSRFGSAVTEPPVREVLSVFAPDAHVLHQGEKAKLGEVILPVPPQLLGTYAPRGRSSNITVNPAAINGAGGLSFAYSGANEGAGTGVVYDTTAGSQLLFRTLAADTTSGDGGIEVSTVGAEVLIGNTLTAANLGGGAGTQGLFSAKSGNTLNFRNITPGSGITFSTDVSGDVVINGLTAANAYVQGGNAFGATGVLGTSDAHPLQIVAGGATAITVNNSGLGVTLVGSETVQGGTVTVGVAGSVTGSLLLAGGGAGSGAVTVNVPSGAAAVTSYSITLPGAQGAANSILVNNGSGGLAWLTQHSVQSTLTTTFSTASTSFVTTGLTVTITPRFASSTIRLTVTGSLGVGGTAAAVTLTIFRGATNIGGTNGLATAGTSATVTEQWPVSVAYTDSPATTSATTYTVFILTTAGTGSFNGPLVANTAVLIASELFT